MESNELVMVFGDPIEDERVQWEEAEMSDEEFARECEATQTWWADQFSVQEFE